MSKFELQDKALQRSGVSHDASLQAIQLTPSVYERLGKEQGLEILSKLFYDRVFDDTDARFTSIFSSSTKQEAIDNQYRFFVQTFGGPDLYREKKGKYTRLVGRHANYGIGHQAADRWVMHMKAALEEHPNLQATTSSVEKSQQQEETKKALHLYFQYTAHYIVAASEYMRPDQLSGGTQIDAGRVW